MKFSLLKVCSLVFVVGFLFCSSVHLALAADTEKGVYYQHGVNQGIKIHTNGTHGSTVLGLAYGKPLVDVSENWTSDCAVMNGDEAKFPWSTNLYGYEWASARDNASRSGVKGYTFVGYMLPEPRVSIYANANSVYKDRSDFNNTQCKFPGKAGEYSESIAK